MKNDAILLVEELNDNELDCLRAAIFWNEKRFALSADFSALSVAEKETVKNAVFEAEITDDIIYKLFENIYFRPANFAAIGGL